MHGAVLAAALAVPGAVPVAAEANRPLSCPPATASPQAEAGLQVSLRGEAAPRGGRVSYRARISNPGPAAPGVTVVDDLRCLLDDAALDGDVTVSAGRAAIGGTLLEWRLDLAAGASATLAFGVKVRGSGGDGRLDHLLSVRGAPSVCASSCRLGMPVAPGAAPRPRTPAVPGARPKPKPQPKPRPPVVEVPMRTVPHGAPPPPGALAAPPPPDPVLAPTTPAELVLSDVPPILPEDAAPLTAAPVAQATATAEDGGSLRFAFFSSLLTALPLLSLVVAGHRRRRRRAAPVPGPRPGPVSPSARASEESRL
ncbi:hypothetical protein GCM10010468_50450 [Actinocorallia longicatena]|uniref:DUF7927 domain-containing protein n=2 Tax=Actinocorallia longicatena TaxID=111803 RepID=A0ABP6QH38_9ACTN